MTVGACSRCEEEAWSLIGGKCRFCDVAIGGDNTEGESTVFQLTVFGWTILARNDGGESV